MSDQSVRIPAQPQDAFNDYARIVADQQLGVVIEFAEHLDEENLKRAVRDLVTAQPVLGCRFVADGRQAWHEPVSDSGSVLVLADADPWSRAVVEAGQALATNASHLAVVLVRGLSRDALAIRVDHTAADGQGVKACVELLAKAYGGSISSDARAIATDRSWRRLRRSAGWPKLLAAAARRKGDPMPTWGLPRSGEAIGPRHHELLALPPVQFAEIVAWAKARRFTVNDVVLAAFYRALFGELQPAEGEQMVLRVSFDQRRCLDPSDPMPAASNLSSVEPLLLGRIADEPFEATAKRASAEMARLKGSAPGLGSALLLEGLYRIKGFSATGHPFKAGMERGQRAGRTYPFLSNFGVLDAAALGFGELQPSRVVVLPVAAHPPFAMLGVSSYSGELTLSLGFAIGEIDPAVPRALLASIDRDLSGLA